MTNKKKPKLPKFTDVLQKKRQKKTPPKFGWMPGDLEVVKDKKLQEAAAKPEVHHDHDAGAEERQHDDKYHQSLKPHHHAAIEYYKDHESYMDLNHVAINGAMRKHRGDMAKVSDEFHTAKGNKHAAARLAHTKALREVTNGARVHSDKHVYRGTHPDAGLHKLKVGEHAQDHGFTSATHNKHLAHDDMFGRHEDYKTGKVEHHIAKIHLPAGTKAHHIDNHGKAHHETSGENEVLIHPGTTYRVTKQEHHVIDGEHHHITHMTVSNQHRD